MTSSCIPETNDGVHRHLTNLAYERVFAGLDWRAPQDAATKVSARLLWATHAYYTTHSMSTATQRKGEPVVLVGALADQYQALGRDERLWMLAALRAASQQMAEWPRQNPDWLFSEAAHDTMLLKAGIDTFLSAISLTDAETATVRERADTVAAALGTGAVLALPQPAADEEGNDYAPYVSVNVGANGHGQADLPFWNEHIDTDGALTLWVYARMAFTRALDSLPTDADSTHASVQGVVLDRLAQAVNASPAKRRRFLLTQWEYYHGATRPVDDAIAALIADLSRGELDVQALVSLEDTDLGRVDDLRLVAWGTFLRASAGAPCGLDILAELSRNKKAAERCSSGGRLQPWERQLCRCFAAANKGYDAMMRWLDRVDGVPANTVSQGDIEPPAGVTQGALVPAPSAEAEMRALIMDTARLLLQDARPVAAHGDEHNTTTSAAQSFLAVLSQTSRISQGLYEWARQGYSSDAGIAWEALMLLHRVVEDALPCSQMTDESQRLVCHAVRARLSNLVLDRNTLVLPDAQDAQRTATVKALMRDVADSPVWDAIKPPLFEAMHYPTAHEGNAHASGLQAYVEMAHYIDTLGK